MLFAVQDGQTAELGLGFWAVKTEAGSGSRGTEGKRGEWKIGPEMNRTKGLNRVSGRQRAVQNVHFSLGSKFRDANNLQISTIRES